MREEIASLTYRQVFFLCSLKWGEHNSRLLNEAGTGIVEFSTDCIREGCIPQWLQYLIIFYWHNGIINQVDPVQQKVWSSSIKATRFLSHSNRFVDHTIGRAELMNPMGLLAQWDKDLKILCSASGLADETCLEYRIEGKFWLGWRD